MAMDAQFKKMMDWRQGYFSEKEMLKECVGVGYVQQLIFVQRCKDFYVAARAEWLNSRHDWRLKQRETAAALAEAQAEVVRLRAAVEAIAKNGEWALTWKPVNNDDEGYTRATLDNGNIARAALETAPAGEA
jgi:hypothetical protein